MSWLTVAAALLSILRSIIDRLHERRIIDAAMLEAAMKGLQETNHAIDQARKAREDARAADARDPDSVLRDDDGFKRKD